MAIPRIWGNADREVSFILKTAAFRFTVAQARLSQTVKIYRLPICLGLVLRIGYSLWLAFIWHILDHSFPLTEKAIHETYHLLSRSSSLAGRSFIDVWLRWDAVHYMNIAKFGYQGVSKGEMIFFPLYPYLVGFLSRITTIDVTLTGILVSSFFTILTLICFYDLVLYLFPDKDLARYSILLFALYPMAFFLHAPFTDALFMFFSIYSILMMVKKKYFVAGVLGCFAGLTRAQGVLLLIPMCVYLVEDHWREKTLLHWQEIVAVILVPAGFGGFMFWRAKEGIPDIFESYQYYSGARFQGPISNLIKSSLITFQYPSYCRIAEVISALLFLIILIWMFTKKEFRKHIGIMLYSAATWVVIISKSGVAGYGLQSVNRYVLHIFFAYVGMAFLLKGQSQKIKSLLLTGLISLSLINLVLYSLWIFVG